MKAHLIIPGTLPSLNDYIREINRGPAIGNRMKRDKTTQIAWESRAAQIPRMRRPVKISFLWVERNSRRDLDNIAFAKKFILDGLVMAGVLKDDSQRYVVGFEDQFATDAQNPRIEVTLEEV